ncbi:hypothetical protein PP935_gp143 [Rhizobium phage RHph_N34]|uniref:Uncharacterized protein n=1 Tax=Rhizobium phage RHph_N34 TaxID=2509586 RepID=A0A7S5RAF8_9CAUD|nr:hypothetical protein PP935_gp143 [Rhizobium phage RHph_N34]QIG73918.1 hypothetical protein EVC06_143 [Rhizobium phage RHph_N34]
MLSEIATMFFLAPLSFIRYAVFVPINIILVLLSWILSPFLAIASVVFRVNVLPGFLQWFSTIDDDLDGGQHQLDWPEVSGLKLVWQRMLWIIRNPAHGWQSKFLGYDISAGTSQIYFRQWKEVARNGESFKGFIIYTGEKKTFFTIKADIPVYGNFYLKLWIGWNERAYDGKYSHFLFQPFLPKKRG